MESDSGKTVSAWFASVEMPSTNKLTKDLETDVCVVGAGISGLTTAYLLARAGKKVVVIDDGAIGGGETGRTTAHISNALDDRYYSLERMHGEKGARLAAESHTEAINQVENIVLREKIDCEFQRLDGYLFEPRGGDPKNIEREFHAARRAGLFVELVDKAQVPFETGRALKFPRQAQFHPLKYLKGLAELIIKLGGSIYTSTRAENIEGGEPGKVSTQDGKTIRAASVVVATNTPINDRVIIHSKQAPYRSYVVAFAIPPESVPQILLWDNDMPYHYVRSQVIREGLRTEHLLIVGGEDHKTGQHDESSAPFGKLEKWTKERYPMVTDLKYKWSGQVMEPVDKLAYIGRNPRDEKNVYVITGDSGNGMTHGTIGGMLISDLILGRANPWETLYDPKRKTHSIKSFKEYVRENADVAAQYADFLMRGEVSSVEEIRPGFGAILRRGTHLVAASRDEQGALHERSAICPHLGCVVKWNHVEKTWDCPCHGSRFTAQGKVVNGPSLGDLNAVK
jgi:glycine/D-amino acid oxidase-like deaminating enzyme/nitrite reductase/ring-hydroxylating ferredoxin subunit